MILLPIDFFFKKNQTVFGNIIKFSISLACSGLTCCWASSESKLFAKLSAGFRKYDIDLPSQNFLKTGFLDPLVREWLSI